MPVELERSLRMRPLTTNIYLFSSQTCLRVFLSCFISILKDFLHIVTTPDIFQPHLLGSQMIKFERSCSNSAVPPSGSVSLRTESVSWLFSVSLYHRIRFIHLLRILFLWEIPPWEWTPWTMRTVNLICKFLTQMWLIHAYLDARRFSV